MQNGITPGAEVSVVVYGAEDAFEAFATVEEAEDYAYQQSQCLPDIAVEWDVYLLPHWCEQDSDEECVCRQYDVSHKPMFSSEEV